MKLSFDFENCFGIHKLQKEFEFKGKQSVAIVYAPNGMMKTSFANTCAEMAKATNAKPKRGRGVVATKDLICDRLNPEAPSKHEIKVDGTDIKPECLFVANPDNDRFDASKHVTDFLASSELKAEYDRIVVLLEAARKDFVNAASTIAKSSDIEEELIKAFTGKDDRSLYDCIDPIAAQLKDDAIFYSFKFNNIFDTGGAVKIFLADNQELLNDYVSQYNQLLSESDLFHTQDGKSFGTYQASMLSKAFKGNEYFTVGHKLVLRNDAPIETAQQYNDEIDREKERIFADAELRTRFNNLSRALDANQDLRDFGEEITRHQEWIPKLEAYEEFRIEVLIGYINHPEVRGKFDVLKQVFEANKADLQHVVEQANLEQEQWNGILDIFNTRFFPPFEVKIENQENVLLKSEEAKLAFKYKDLQGHKIPQSREGLLTILSKGEQRSFMMLQFLFAIEARKGWDDTSVIVMDDISDSFDYQNKYAIVEYIKDLAANYPDKFKIILLTHNFDFYRTVASRLNGMVQQYMAVKQSDGTIRIDNGVYVMKTPFELEMKNSQKPGNFVAMIPFVRNLTEYYKEKNSYDYVTLTRCLHVREGTEDITDVELEKVFKAVKSRKLKYEPTGERVVDIIFREADRIEVAEEEHVIMIEDKIVLSIAIRLKAEFFLKRELMAAGKSEADLASERNQTSEWIDLYKSLTPPPAEEKLRVMEEVNMMTPEYIHINSFMYEPLIDMSIHHLIVLYGRVKKLANNE